MTLQQEIAAVLNRHSQENASNTPDFVLAQYMLSCLQAFNVATQHRAQLQGPRQGVLARDEASDLRDFVRECRDDSHVIGDAPIPSDAALRAMEKLASYFDDPLPL